MDREAGFYYSLKYIWRVKECKTLSKIGIFLYYHIKRSEKSNQIAHEIINTAYWSYSRS